MISLIKKGIGLILGSVIYLSLLSGMPAIFWIAADAYFGIGYINWLSAGLGFLNGLYLLIQFARSKFANDLNDFFELGR